MLETSGSKISFPTSQHLWICQSWQLQTLESQTVSFNIWKDQVSRRFKDKLRYSLLRFVLLLAFVCVSDPPLGEHRKGPCPSSFHVLSVSTKINSTRATSRWRGGQKPSSMDPQFRVPYKYSWKCCVMETMWIICRMNTVQIRKCCVKQPVEFCRI